VYLAGQIICNCGMVHSKTNFQMEQNILSRSDTYVREYNLFFDGRVIIFKVFSFRFT